jgi:hypothetical protein
VEPIAQPIMVRGRVRGRDRRQVNRFVLWNRRSGFDRRQRPDRSQIGAALDSSLVYLRDHPPVLMGLLVLGNLLSLLDFWLTSIVLRLGAIEANPFMAYFFAADSSHAALVKFGLIIAASLGIWALRRRRVALLAALFFVSLYAVVVLYEVAGLTQLAL